MSTLTLCWKRTGSLDTDWGKKTIEPGQSLVIGRGSSADIRLDDSKVSRQHTRIVRNDDQLLITDPRKW